MDLRPYLRSDSVLASVRQLVGETHFIYQPFIFADDLEVGIGYESICANRGAGMVYWPGAPLNQYPLLGRFLLKDDGARPAFSTANEQLRRINDSYVDQICAAVGNISSMTIADVGCFAGYFPVSFSKRGARESVGFDIDDRSGCFDVLNRILGTNARFVHAGYDRKTGAIKADQKYDLVICHDLVQHMIEPLRFIRALSDLATEALFLKCPGWLENSGEQYLTIGEPFGISHGGEFPWCFDHDVILSWRLLERSLELCGFKRVVPIHTVGFPTPQPTGNRQFTAFCVLAFRE